MTAGLPVLSLYGGAPKPLGSRDTESAILKSAISPPWKVTRTGVEGDRQADTINHGGPEKALHHYPMDHYASWQAEMPQLADALSAVPAFGENISTLGLVESDVCIGDIYRLGSVRLQISQGRQPCWKLNARFGVDDMAFRVQKTGRTGWYYRVLEPGAVEPGDVLSLNDRPQPAWPLSRIIALLYHKTGSYDDLAALAEVRELAEGWRRLAARRVQSRQVEDWRSRLEGNHDAAR
jgi:MOSC domain-containing protein YiiM